MAFTRISESNIAGILGSIYGKAAGTVTSKAEDTLKSLQTKLLVACKKVVDDETNGIRVSEGYTEIDQIETTAKSVRKTLDTLETSVNSLGTTILGIEAPTTGLKTAIAVIKALPIPQKFMLVSLSMVEADLMQMLSELVTQIESIVTTLKGVISTISNLIKKIKDLLENLQKILDSMKVSAALSKVTSDKDRAALFEKGIINDKGQDIFSRLASLSGETDILWFGDLAGIDRYSISVQNSVKSTKSGQRVDISLSNSGDWISYAFRKSTVKPDKPVTRELRPEGWTLVEPSKSDYWWYSRAVVSGLDGKVDVWTEPDLYSNKSPKYPNTVGLSQNYSGKSKSVLVYRLSKTQIDLSKFNYVETYAVILDDTDLAYTFMLNALDSINGLENLKSSLSSLLNSEQTTTVQELGVNSDYYYKAPNGESYKLQIVVDTSYVVAKRRYVEALDDSGVVVYTGTKSFATSDEILLEEARVKLSQLLI